MKTYTIIKSRRGTETASTGTLEELIGKFSYTLERGHSWENEPGNRRINMRPKTIRSLIDNLNKSENNAALNGCSSVFYRLAE